MPDGPAGAGVAPGPDVALDGDESERPRRGILTPMLFDEGLTGRADDRGTRSSSSRRRWWPAPDQFEEIAAAIRQASVQAMKEMS